MSTSSYLKTLAFQLAPKGVRNKALAIAENKKISHWRECFKTKVSREQVDKLFARLSLNSDVMIHSSLPDIGNIKTSHVTDNLKEYVLDKGYTILCPALPVKGSSLEYLKSITEFDVRSASNAMGTISCYYGRQPEALRSLSPTHSVVAYGDRAAYYTQDHHLSETPFAENSPYFKLMLEDGKLLMFGASLKSLTFRHIVEDMIGEESFPVKVYDRRRFEIKLVNEDGTAKNGVFRAHSRRSSRLRDSDELLRIIRELPSTKVFPLGCGEVVLLDTRDVCLCLLRQLKSGITTMGRRRVSDKCIARADHWIDYIEHL